MKNYPHKFIVLVFVNLCTVILIGCSKNQDGAPKAITAYINALSNRDTVQISNLSCADWEKSALLEVDSLTAVGSKVVDLSCDQSGQQGEDIYVSCKGMLSLDYNGEAQQIDFSSRTYIARQEGGEWRMCGYH